MTIYLKTLALLISLCASLAIASESEPAAAALKKGFRFGYGLSGFQKHKALAEENWPKALAPKPNFLAYSLGFASAIDFGKYFSFAPELQYSFYSASGEKTNNERSIINDANFKDMNEIFVYLHSLELPIMARFNIGSAYAELGPQAGYNFYAKTYMNNQPRKPSLNAFAFGPSAGFGFNADGMGIIMVGVRGYYGVLEYAKSGGHPWHAELSITVLAF
jgi:hypothetical protein